jgi:hypothetical protein
MKASNWPSLSDEDQQQQITEAYIPINGNTSTKLAELQQKFGNAMEDHVIVESEDQDDGWVTDKSEQRPALSTGIGILKQGTRNCLALGRSAVAHRRGGSSQRKETELCDWDIGA